MTLAKFGKDVEPLKPLIMIEAKKGEWEFSRHSKDIPVWGCTRKNGICEIGPYYVTFDKKTIYNLWCDYRELTEEQKELVKQFNYLMWSLTCNRD